MKIIFAGTPQFAATALAAICAAGHELLLVLTQPDRPAGRGMKLTPTPVATLADTNRLRVEKLSSLKTPAAEVLIRQTNPDIIVVAAYGLLLPQPILDIPRYGCINIHGSLLPRWRGAAPVQRAIEAGDTQTGIDIMQMEAGLDTGPILLESILNITPDETSDTLFTKLAALGAESVVQALERIPGLQPVPQSTMGATYAKKIERAEARIDWQQSATSIERRIRAFDPFPGCETTLSGERLKIWHATVCERSAGVTPGTLFNVARNSFTVACGGQALEIDVVQRAGGRRLTAAEFMQSFSISTGQQCI
ncbi:MAG: methionyl-tRNA formyltransferase [Aeromicrobium sp.]|nr:methionyl-tRNA formyltransferase [Burkholderiales bacterium]